MRTLIALFSIFLLTACQSSPAVIDYDTSRSFENISSYSWFTEAKNETETENTNSLLSERVERAISQHLNLTQAAKPETADLWLRYRVQSAIKQQESGTRGGIGLGGGSGGAGVGISLSLPLGGPKVLQIIDLNIDFLDPANQRMVWQGSTQLTLDEEAAPETITRELNEAVAELLKDFPPR